MSLDNEKLIPNRKQRDWLAGQAHIIERDGLLKETEEAEKVEDETFTMPSLQFIGAEEAYSNSITKLKQINPSPNNLFEVFLAEKSLDIQKIE